MKHLLEIIIVTWNSRNEIGECLTALAVLPKGWRVTLVDNASADDTVQFVRAHFPFVTLINNAENVGFARANNQVINTTDSDYVLLLNPDTVASCDAIRAALDKLLSMPSVGILGVKILNTDGTMQPSVQGFPTFFRNLVIAFGLHALLPAKMRSEFVLYDYWPHDEERQVDMVSGAFMMASREAIKLAGPLPESYFLYFEEADWSYRMLAGGYLTWFTPDISIVHHGNRSGEQTALEWRTSIAYESKYRFCRAHFGRFRTLLIMLVDLIGCAVRKVYYSFKRPTADVSARLRLAAYGRDAVLRLLRS